MRWVNVAVKPHFSWPNVQVEFVFEGRRLVLQPLTDALSCTVSLYDPNGLSFEEGGGTIYRFLSRLAWSMDGGVAELFINGSNNPARPGQLGRGSYSHVPPAQIPPWEFLYLPQPKSEMAELAIALYREGMSLNSIPFSFLSYFKVINMLDADWRKQVDWIAKNLNGASYPPAKRRLDELMTSHPDVGHYLYVSGRCAVAHAFSSPIVNPDNYADKKRLEDDLPLMKEIAALCVEKEFGVLSDSSFSSYLKQADINSPELLRRERLENGTLRYVPSAN